MGRLLQNLMAIAAAVCVSATAFGQSGNSDDQDVEFRFSLRLTAALNNDPEAQYQVAEMYEQGTGTPQNLRMAHLWYSKSAKQGYRPAIEKLDNWEKKKLEAENQARERAAAEQKRRQAESEAAAASRAAREEAAKAARERAAEEQKRMQAEATARAAREEAAAAKAARERAAEEQKRLQSETAAVAAAKAAREAAARTAPKPETVPVVKETPAEPPKEKPVQPAAKSAEKDAAEFKTNPCKTPTAKFMSVCQ